MQNNTLMVIFCRVMWFSRNNLKDKTVKSVKLYSRNTIIRQARDRVGNE
jgi:hypothetical protein